MYYLTEIVCAIAEVLMIYIFLNGMFWKREKATWQWFLGYGLFGTVIMLLSFVSDTLFVRVGFSFTGVVALALCLYISKPLTAVYASIAFNAIYALTDTIMMVALSAGYLTDDVLLQHGNARSAFLITSHIALFTVILLVLSVIKQKQGAITFQFFVLLFPGWLTGIVYGCTVNRLAQESVQDLPVTFILVAFGILYLNILIVIYTERMKLSYQMRQELAIQEYHDDMQEKYYAQLHAEQEETRALRHDIGKYISAMQALIGNNDMENATLILEEVRHKLNDCCNIIDVNNTIISIILNEYAQAANQANVQFKLDVQVPSMLAISAVDLYVLIGNTLDNALMACRELPVEQRSIKLQLRMHNNILFYQVENPYPPNYLKRRRERGHGYGLNNVRRCVEKYRGDIEIVHEDGSFCVSTHLNQVET